MRITNCKVNHLTDPMGYDLGKPVFSWNVCESKGRRPISSCLKILQSANTEFDSGWAELDNLCTRPDIQLSPRTRYTWSVSVKTDAGEEADSGEYFFETGRMDEVWTGKWIGCDDSEARLPYFSKSFQPHKTVKTARLYICGLGTYEAFLNGKRVGDERMTPYCNNYNAWVQYQTFDVTEM
ncbi:MAG: alpha-L-rhamnosidase N-terminal domain-containing protein, partial [Clostridia bacterium]|nr:alpha-L-rhamnosidase N-terminal domain-containing protein [Clostridia bacterium]